MKPGVTKPNLPRPSRGARLALHLGALAAAVLLGLLVAWLATALGRPDGRAVGPLFAPLAIAGGFVGFGLLLGALHARDIRAAFDRFLPPSEKALRAIVLLVAVGATYQTVRLCLFHFLGVWLTDFPSYHYASLALSRGLDPYDPTRLAVVPGQQVFPYVYPPFLALVWMPFARLPLATAGAIWQALSLVALAGSLALAVRIARPSSPAARAAALLTALLLPLGVPTFVGVHHGAVSFVFVFLVLLCFERLRRGSDVAAGAALALACGIKVLPVVLLPYLALKRRWRALFAALAAGAVLLLLSVLAVGWQVHWRFVTEIAPQIGYATHSKLGFDAVFFAENQSLNGFFSRSICGAGSGCAGIVVALCLATALPVLWSAARRRDVDGVELSRVAIVLLLVSPITWLHHLLLVNLAAIVLATRIVDGAWRPRGWPLVVLAVAVILAHDAGVVVPAVRDFVPWTNLRLFMLLLLYAALLHAGGARRRAAAAG
jgi:hypothetical protein